VGAWDWVPMASALSYAGPEDASSRTFLDRWRCRVTLPDTLDAVQRCGLPLTPVLVTGVLPPRRPLHLFAEAQRAGLEPAFPIRGGAENRTRSTSMRTTSAAFCTPPRAQEVPPLPSRFWRPC
jgi:hypothetical protein